MIKYLKLFGLSFLIACGQNEEKEPEKNYLQIVPVLDSPLETDKFLNGTTIGLFVTDKMTGENYNNCSCSANIPMVLHDPSWILSREVEIVDPGDVTAYCPYNSMLTSGKNIPIETASQTDYLYSDITGFTKSNPEAKITMKHALSLVRFKIEKPVDGSDIGPLSGFRLERVGLSGTMDCSSGNLQNTEFGSETYAQGENIPCVVSVMAFPQSKGSVNAIFIIDGKEYPYEAKGNWDKGKEIIYTLQFDPEMRTLLSVGSTIIQDWAIGGNYDGDLSKPLSGNDKI